MTATPARAEYPAAPDVVVFCEPTLRHAIADVAGLCNRLVIAASASAGSVNLAEVAGKAPIAIVDPPVGVAGIEGEKALQSLGLWDAVRIDAVGVVDTADAAFLLKQGKVRLALVYTTDVAADPSLAVVDRLSDASYSPIVYWMAQTEHSLSPNTSKFTAFLHQTDTQSRLRADGLEVLP